MFFSAESRNFHQLKQEIGSRDPIERSYDQARPTTGTDITQQEQAAILYRAYKEHFLLDDQALELIQSITGIDTFILKLKRVVAEKYKAKYELARFDKNKLKSLYLEAIQDEIAARESYNKGYHLKKKSTKDLEECKQIINAGKITYNKYWNDDRTIQIGSVRELDLTGNHNEILYKIYINSLRVKKAEVKLNNSKKRFFWQKQNTYHLTSIEEMLEYYRDGRADVQKPFKRMEIEQVRVEALKSHFTIKPEANSSTFVLRFTQNIKNLWSFVSETNRKLKRLLAIHNSTSLQLAQRVEAIKFDLEDVANKIQQQVPIVSRNSVNITALVQFSEARLGNTYKVFMENLTTVNFPRDLQNQDDDIKQLQKHAKSLAKTVRVKTPLKNRHTNSVPELNPELSKVIFKYKSEKMREILSNKQEREACSQGPSIICLNNVKQLIEVNKFMIGLASFNLQNSSTTLVNGSGLKSLSTVSEATNKNNRSLLEALRDQVILLNLFLKDLDNLHSYYLGLVESSLDLNANDSFEAAYKHFLTENSPNETAIQAQYDSIRNDMAKNLADMKMWAEEVKSSKQAIKFFAGQASYKLKSGAREEVYQTLISSPS